MAIEILPTAPVGDPVEFERKMREVEANWGSQKLDLDHISKTNKRVLEILNRKEKIGNPRTRS